MSNVDINYDSYRQLIPFTLLLSICIPSIICTIFVLSYFFSHWNSMITKSYHHHAIFLLMIISFLYNLIDLPFSLNYFRVGYHWYRSISFCLWWYWIDYSLLSMSLYLTATASLQRHILIFKSHWLHINKKRWIFHYIPLIFSIIYPPLFYLIFMFIYQCSVYFNSNDGWCAYPCYIDEIILYNIDWFINTILPVLIIIVANMSLLIRVYRSMKRIRLDQTPIWKRQKKLTLQLFAFSSLYIIVWFPTTLVAILRALAFPDLYNQIPNLYYIYYLIYFVCPLQSFLCVLALPELIDFTRRKAKRILTRTMIMPFPTIQPAR